MVVMAVLIVAAAVAMMWYSCSSSGSCLFWGDYNNGRGSGDNIMVALY